jgi:hypothetical protein
MSPTINRKLKTKLHFNRVNMARGKPEVWTASNSKACFQSQKLIVVHDGEVLLETNFAAERQQPRAYFECRGTVTISKGVAIIEI